MADIPVPRSYNQIVQEMLDELFSRTGYSQIRPGSPLLSLVMSAAQSDFRNSADIFNALKSIELDLATGQALDRIGNSEKCPRLGRLASSGYITVTDSSIDKIQGFIYQGKPAPIIGSTTIYVADAQDFTSTGSVYLGRGTDNFEGPIGYDTLTLESGGFYSLHLTSGTQHFHNLNETVVLAQGSDRTIPAGTIIQTPQGNNAEAINFSTVYAATIPDGETEVSNIFITAQQLGVSGNVGAGSISVFASAPFVGAVVTNPLPLTNGRDIETDDDYRARIKMVRQSRARATDTAILSSVEGQTATDENRTILSQSIISQKGYPTVLYIDDGTGYEEKETGVALEVLADSASGGEQYFQVSQKPVAKASLTTTATAPFSLTDGCSLYVKVGGVVSEHTFPASHFRNIANATAYEVASSINSNAEALFQARTGDNANVVVLTAKAETGEDLQITGGTAQSYLIFTTTPSQTLWLYRNDVLLHKDGLPAILYSKPLPSWNAPGDGVEIDVDVDGTGTHNYIINDQDFIDAGTGYGSVGINSIEAWVAVLNLKIPGITASAVADTIALTSNLGAKARASISIGPETLGGIFTADSVQGTDNDYSFDRNRGQLRLSTPLSAGDRLVIGSEFYRPFLDSATISATNLNSDALLFVGVDSGAKIVPVGVNGTSAITITEPSVVDVNYTGLKRVRVASDKVDFLNVRVNDIVRIWDSAASMVPMHGTWRISDVDPTGYWFEVDRKTGAYDQSAFYLAENGILFVRNTTTRAPLQTLSVGADSNYTATSFASVLNPQILGGAAQTVRTNKVRLSSSSVLGNISFLGNNAEGQKLLMTVGSREAGLSQAPAITSVASDTDFPLFLNTEVGPYPTTSSLTVLEGIQSRVPANARICGLGLHALPLSQPRAGNLQSMVTDLESSLVDTLTLRQVQDEIAETDRFYASSPFAIHPQDKAIVVLDNDSLNRKFSIPFSRRLKPSTPDYLDTVTYKDADNDNAALGNVFGTDFDFRDFALFMPARAITYGSTSTVSRLLWKYKRPGPDGELTSIAFGYPSLPSQGLAMSVLQVANDRNLITVALASDAAKPLSNIRVGTRIATHYQDLTNRRKTVVVFCGFKVTNAIRDNDVVTLTLDLDPFNLLTTHDSGLQIGDQIYFKSDYESTFPSSIKTLTYATGSTIKYTEVRPDASQANPGRISFDSADATFESSPTAIVAGDIWSSGPNSGIEELVFRVSYADTDYPQCLAGTIQDLGQADDVTVWAQLLDTTKLSVFPLNSVANNPSDIVAFAGSATGSPVTAVAFTDDTAISKSSYDEREEVHDMGGVSYDIVPAHNYWHDLVDGINWVKARVGSGLDYQLTTKNSPSGSLAGDIDWLNTYVYIVPITTACITRWMNAPVVTGLSNVGAIAATAGSRLQLSSAESGSAAAVQVQGGSANTLTLPVMGSATLTDAESCFITTVDSSAAQNLVADSLVAIDNTFTLSKARTYQRITIKPSGGFRFHNTTPSALGRAWAYADDEAQAKVLNKLWKVEKQGAFVCYSCHRRHWDGWVPAVISSGSWVRVMTSTGTPGLSTPNKKDMRIIQSAYTYDESDHGMFSFWVENSDSVEEEGYADVHFLSADSLMPGDVITIGESAGVGNTGSWVIEALGQTDGTGDEMVNKGWVRVTVPAGVTVEEVPDTAAVGGINFSEGRASRLVKRIKSLYDDGTLMHVKFSGTANEAALVSAAAGSVLSALDKLNFSQDLVTGQDGYRYNVGLIGEANRILYGSPGNRLQYPGVVASGASVDIHGPVIKSIRLGFSVRRRTGVKAADIVSRVKSVAAAAVNRIGVGQPIAISRVIAEVSRVNGVASVAITYPTYDYANDMISVQAQEKPMVLNIEDDITVSFVGE